MTNIKALDKSQKTDEELVVLSLSNQEIFGELVKRYEGKLLSYIMKLSNISPEEAEDILQDAIIKAYRNLNDFDTSLKFSSWMYRIVRNEVISHYRKTKVRPQGHMTGIDDTVFETIASDLDTSKDIDIQLLRENIDGILATMDKKYKEVLVLKYFEQLSYQEISDILQKPMGTIATLISRAKEQFQREAAQQKIEFAIT